MHYFTFPQVRVQIDKDMPDSFIAVVGGGRSPSGNWLTRLKNSAKIWCADSGVDICCQHNIVPEKVIGDADSATSKSWKWACNQSISVEKHPVDKDYTDLQLALKAIGKQYNKQATVLLTGGFDGRFDHLMCNIYSMIWSQEWGITPLGIADDRELLFLLKGPSTIHIEMFLQPNVISLLPFTPLCEGVNSEGLKWGLKDNTLSQTHLNSISNRLEEGRNQITVSLVKGWLGIYLTDF